jgi:hypothetical protein
MPEFSRIIAKRGELLSITRWLSIKYGKVKDLVERHVLRASSAAGPDHGASGPVTRGVTSVWGLTRMFISGGDLETGKPGFRTGGERKAAGKTAADVLHHARNST